jgi:anti-anti-sigma regulatory factor
MNTLTLAARQTIENARELKDDFLAALDLPESVQVDASEVAQIDTAALQLLAVFWRTSARYGKLPGLIRPSPEFARVAGLLGLDSLFGLPPRASTAAGPG